MSAEAYVLRRSTRADAAPVWSLRNKAIRAGCRGHYPAAELAKWCAGEYTAAWVQRVTDSGQVICAGGVIVASGMLDTHKGQIDALFVASQRIRSGLGRKMLKYL